MSTSTSSTSKEFMCVRRTNIELTLTCHDGRRNDGEGRRTEDLVRNMRYSYFDISMVDLHRARWLKVSKQVEYRLQEGFYTGIEWFGKVKGKDGKLAVDVNCRRGLIYYAFKSIIMMMVMLKN